MCTASWAVLALIITLWPGFACADSPVAPPSSQPALHYPSAKRLPVYAAAKKAMVTDLRASQNEDSYRLVFDLNKKVRIVQRRDKATGRLHIDLVHTGLSHGAAEKFVALTILPQDAHVTLQQQAKALRLSLNKQAVGQVNYFLLERPHRFVLDFTPVSSSGSGSSTTAAAARQDPPSPVATSTDKGESSAAETAPSPAPPLPTPSSPAPASTAPGREAASTIQTIVLDPGHGGKDSGTISRRGLMEKQITLKVALRLRHLIKTRLGKKVLMTRDHDTFIELGDRAKFANANNADLFVSIHVNSHPQSSVKGIEVYHFGEAKDQRAIEVAARENGTPISTNGVGWEYLVADLLTTKRIEESLELAWQTKEAMVQRLTNRYPTDDHGVKTAPFYVLRYTAMPSILAEIAFMSNPSEEKLLRQTSFINEVAEALYQGVKNYLTPSDPASP